MTSFPIIYSKTGLDCLPFLPRMKQHKYKESPRPMVLASAVSHARCVRAPVNVQSLTQSLMKLVTTGYEFSIGKKMDKSYFKLLIKKTTKQDKTSQPTLLKTG